MDLSRRIELLRATLGAEARALAEGQQGVKRWHKRVAAAIAGAHWLAANRRGPLTPVQRAIVERDVRIQLGYLMQFADRLEEEGWWPSAYSRAISYADAIRVPWWRSETAWARLPAMPGQGTACQTRCKCSWRLVEVSPTLTLAYWETGAAEHCPTCQMRAKHWNPCVVTDNLSEFSLQFMV